MSLTREDLIELACKTLVDNDEGGFFGACWPDSPDDTGHRGGGGYVRLIQTEDQAALRAAMGFVVDGILQGVWISLPDMMEEARRHRAGIAAQ
jgi:hypothetical protein